MEFRRAELTPAAGLVEVDVVGTGRKMYLHPTVEITNEDIVQARAVLVGDSRPTIVVLFTKTGAEKMTKLSESYPGQRLGILVDGEFVMSLVLGGPVTDNAIAISPPMTRTEAVGIAAGIDGKARVPTDDVERSEWKTLAAEGKRLYFAGEYEHAVVVAKQAVEMAERIAGSDDYSVAESLNILAVTYHTMRKYEEAEPLYTRALSIREKAYGPEHPSVAEILNNLAELFRTRRKYAQAEPLYIRALAIREKTLGPNHPDVATSLEGIAALYRATDRDRDAEKLEQRVAAIRATRR